MSESVFWEVGEDVEVNLRWSLPVTSLHLSKENINRTLFVSMSFLFPAIRKNTSSSME